MNHIDLFFQKAATVVSFVFTSLLFVNMDTAMKVVSFLIAVAAGVTTIVLNWIKIRKEKKEDFPVKYHKNKKRRFF